MHISLLGYAILSLLVRTPLSGYDIAREMKRPHAFFFGHAQISQIYPELAHLQEAGLVTSALVEQQGRPDKRVYTIAPAGLERLRRWLVEPTPILEVRSELLIKAHSLWLADAEVALARFREHERYHSEQLAGYEAYLAEIEERWGAALALQNTPTFGDYLTLKRGVGYEREYVSWLRWVVAILEERVRHHAQDEEAAP
jgi:PadR family transcriptional regulator, regulatory protein AphA